MLGGEFFKSLACNFNENLAMEFFCFIFICFKIKFVVLCEVF